MNDYNEPYFATNEDWYYYDEIDEMYKLTKRATKEAIKSYEEFYKELEKDDLELEKAFNIGNEDKKGE